MKVVMNILELFQVVFEVDVSGWPEPTLTFTLCGKEVSLCYLNIVTLNMIPVEKRRGGRRNRRARRFLSHLDCQHIHRQARRRDRSSGSERAWHSREQGTAHCGARRGGVAQCADVPQGHRRSGETFFPKKSPPKHSDPSVFADPPASSGKQKIGALWRWMPSAMPPSVVSPSLSRLPD